MTKASTEEQERIDEIIENHLNSLDKQLKEKKLFSFWVFPDKKSFKKLNKMNSTDVQKMIKKDVDKYKNRKIAKISIVIMDTLMN